MATALRRFALTLVLCGLAAGPLFAQTGGEGSPFGFKMDLGIGVQSFNEADPLTGASPTTYQSLGLSPDISFGKLGVGLAITINYRFDANNNLAFRQADWVPTSFQSFLQIYLPKIKYVRWGEKGDPLFLKFGSIDDGTLGDGFIVGEYANTLFLPGDRHFGLAADLDGSLFNFPFVGVETFIGNLAILDVMGGRVYVRPLVTTSIPILNNLEVGATYAIDTNPYFNTNSTGVATPISAFGGDMRLPIVYVKDIVSLVAFTDVASIQGKSWGGMLGVGGRLINFVTYGAQLRLLGPDFIPVYFGPTYDLYRDYQYNQVNTGGFSSGTMGWFASLGTSFLDDKIVFNISLDGPFIPPTNDPAGLLSYPHLRGILSLVEGVVPGISFDFSYDKRAIASFGDLVSPKDAAIQAQLNFKTGPAVISFVYKIVYAEGQTPPWNITSGLQTSISLF